jgi:flagellar basal-body rod protein FlgC
MPLSINSGISALNALGTRQAVTANNVANLDTPKFKRATTVLEEGESGSLSVKVQQVNSPGVMINQPDGSLEELSNVDLGKELSDMIPTRHGYEANIKALETQDEMEDSVIDLLG